MQQDGYTFLFVCRGSGLVSPPLLILPANKHQGNIWNMAVGLSAARKFYFFVKHIHFDNM